MPQRRVRNHLDLQPQLRVVLMMQPGSERRVRRFNRLNPQVPQPLRVQSRTRDQSKTSENRNIVRRRAQTLQIIRQRIVPPVPRLMR